MVCKKINSEIITLAGELVEKRYYEVRNDHGHLIEGYRMFLIDGKCYGYTEQEAIKNIVKEHMDTRNEEHIAEQRALEEQEQGILVCETAFEEDSDYYRGF